MNLKAKIVLIVGCLVVAALAYLYLSPLPKDEACPDSSDNASLIASEPSPSTETNMMPPPADTPIETHTDTKQPTTDTAQHKETPIKIAESTQNTQHLSEEEEMAQTVEWFRNPETPLKQRRKALSQLAKQDDTDAIRTLKTLGDARIYLNRFAIEELGGIKNNDVSVYLKSKLTNSDALIVCAAIRALSRVKRDNAIDDLIATIENNRVRPDGYQDMIADAAITMMGSIGSNKALPFLSMELERSEDKGWNLEYGSKILNSIDKLGGGEGRLAASRYADRLATRIPDDPLAGQYYRDKIAEARKIADQ